MLCEARGIGFNKPNLVCFLLRTLEVCESRELDITTAISNPRGSLGKATRKDNFTNPHLLHFVPALTYFTAPKVQGSSSHRYS